MTTWRIHLVWGDLISSYALWQYNQKVQSFPAGKILRIILPDAALVHWSTDEWQTTHDVQTRDTGLGVHIVDLAIAELAGRASLIFTFEWTASGAWEGENYSVQVEE